MGIPSINSLANMEYMLYGGISGNRTDCPSMYNSYNTAQMSNYAQNPYSVFGYNPAFASNYGNSIYDSYSPSYQGVNQGVGAQGASSQQTFGASQQDIDTLINYHLKSVTPSESLLGAAVGGAAFGVMNNPRVVFHPWNSIKATIATDKMFASAKEEGSKLYELWRNEKTSGILQEAYARTNKLEALNPELWKAGLFRKSLPEKEYNRLKKLMETALKSGNTETIAKATEEIKRATNAFTGYIPRGLRKIGLQKQMQWLRNKINPNQYRNFDEVVKENLKANEKMICKETGKISLGKSLSKSCGLGNGLLFAGLEFVTSWGNIKEAFSNDSSRSNNNKRSRKRSRLGNR